MKRILISVLLVALALSLMAFQRTGLTQTNPCSEMVMGGSCVLQSDETLQSGMLIMGGSVVLEEGSTVEGDVVVMGGNVTANGTIEGDLNLVGGNATLGSDATVEGDVNTVGGNLDRREGAEIEGSYNRNVPAPFPFEMPGRMDIPNWDTGSNIGPGDWSGPVNAGLGLIGSIFWWLARSLLWAVLALILMLLLPRHTERVAAEITTRPVESGGLGCLTAIIAPLILVVLTITICLIPVTVVASVVLTAAWGLGMIAMGYELGKRLVRGLKRDWAPAVTAALGTAVLTLGLNGVMLIPCIGFVGWVAAAVIGAVGLGAVLLTRFGTQNNVGGSWGGLFPPATPASSYGAYGTPANNPASPAASGAPLGGEIPPTVGVYSSDEPVDPQPYDPNM